MISSELRHEYEKRVDFADDFSLVFLKNDVAPERKWDIKYHVPEQLRWGSIMKGIAAQIIWNMAFDKILPCMY